MFTSHLETLSRLDQQHPLVDIDDAIRALVKDTTDEYGSSARDVIQAIYTPSLLRKSHEQVKGVTYDSLYTSVNEGMYMMRSESSDSVIAVSRVFDPDQAPSFGDMFSVSFKSIRIGQKLMEIMVCCGEHRVRDMFDLYRTNPRSSSLADWAFETYSHFMMSRNDPSLLPRIKMSLKTPTKRNAPTFITTESPHAPLPQPNPYSTRTFTIIDIPEFIQDTGLLQLSTSTYYVPEASSKPFFDAFFIDVTRSMDSIACTIWIVNMSTTHGSSAHDHATIQHLIERVTLQAEQLAQPLTLVPGLPETESNVLQRPAKKLRLGNLAVTTQVNFLHVSPDGLSPSGSERQWDMPEAEGPGWKDLQECTTCPSQVFFQPIRI